MTQRLIELREQALSAVDVFNASVMTAQTVFNQTIDPIIQEMDGIEAPDNFKAAVIRDIYEKVGK